MISEFLLADPHVLGRPAELGWWPRGDLALFAMNVQYALLSPRGRGWGSFCFAGFERRSGQDATLQVLDRCVTEAEQRAVLKAGLLFSLLDSSRAPQWDSKNFPGRRAMRDLQGELWAQAGLDQSPWSHLHTLVLPPVQVEGHTYQAPPEVDTRQAFPTVQELSAELDHLVARVLTAWAPVCVRFTPDAESSERVRDTFEREPEVVAARAAHAADAAAWSAAAAVRTAERAAQAAEERAHFEAQQAKHPRYGQWPLSAAELKVLVWAQPLTAVANLFGVSDTAIRKFCDKRGIERPPQGYWLRAGNAQSG